MVDITPGDSGANKGYWRVQLRDRFGKFVEMGGAVMFDIQLPGVIGKSQAVGNFIGNAEPGLARIEVKDNKKIPKGIYLVKSEDITAIEAILPEEYVEQALSPGTPEADQLVPAAPSFDNPLRTGPLDSDVYLRMVKEAKKEDTGGVLLRDAGLFGEGGLFENEDIDFIKGFLNSEKYKKVLRDQLQEAKLGASIKPENMPAGWEIVDPGEAFFKEYGATIEELEAFMDISADDPQIDDLVFNDSKKFILNQFDKYRRKYADQELDEIASLKIDHYKTSNGSLAKMYHTQTRDPETREFGESYTATNEQTLVVVMEGYSKLNDQYPLGRSAVLKLMSESVTDEFDRPDHQHVDHDHIDEVELDQRKKRKNGVVAFARPDGSISFNFSRDIAVTGTREEAKNRLTEAAKLAESVEEGGFQGGFLEATGYSISDIEKLDDFTELHHVLAHEYGHLYDFSFIGTVEWTSYEELPADVVSTEDSKTISELYKDGKTAPSKYGTTNVSEFFAEHFAQNFIKGSSRGERSEEVLEVIEKFKKAAPKEGEGLQFEAPGKVNAMFWEDLNLSYQTGHKAPRRDPENADAANLDKLFPSNIYDKSVREKYYSTGFPAADRESFAAIDAINRDPEATVQIYRAVPDDVASINPGDWVTLSPNYAEEHLKGALNGKGKILSVLTKAKDLFTDANSINEWGWDPAASIAAPRTATQSTDVSELEIEALKWYTDNGYDTTSKLLREGLPIADEEDKAYLDALLDLIARSKTQEDLTTYRGMAITSEERLAAIEALVPGDKITDRGIMSMSELKTRAEFYAQMTLGGRAKGHIMFELEVPAGTSAYVIPDRYSSYRGQEQEILLAPNSTLEVSEVSVDFHGRKSIKVRVVPAEAEEQLPASTPEGGTLGDTAEPAVSEPEIVYDKFKSQLKSPFMSSDVMAESQSPEVSDWVKSHFTSDKTLTPEMKKIRANYIIEDDNTIRINKELRDDIETDLDIKGLDTWTTSESVTNPVRVYRGLILSPEAHEKYQVGSKFVDKAYSSVAVNRNQILHYLMVRKNAGAAGDQVEFRINLDVGQPMGIADMGEIVLPRNSEFEVLKRTKTESGRIVLEIRPLPLADTTEEDTAQSGDIILGDTTWDAPPTEVQAKALEDYGSGELAIDANSYLRTGKSELYPLDENYPESIQESAKQHLEELKQRIDDLSSAFDSSSLSKDMTVYRSLSDPSFGFDYDLELGEGEVLDLSRLEGTIYTDKGFISTTKKADFSYIGSPIRLKINAKAGQKAIDLAGVINLNPREEEVIFPAGSKFRISKAYFDNNANKYHVEMDYLDGDDSALESKPESIYEDFFDGEDIDLEALRKSENRIGKYDREMFTDDQLKALEEYGQAGYRKINKLLRENATLTPEQEELIRLIDESIEENGDLFSKGRVFRGDLPKTGSEYQKFLQDLEEGKTFTFPGYFSTSNDAQLAFSEFGPGIGSGDSEASATHLGPAFFWTIDIPEDGKAMAMPDDVGYGQGAESEVLLPRNSNFKIIGIKKVEQIDDEGQSTGEFNYFINAEQIPTKIEPEAVETESAPAKKTYASVEDLVQDATELQELYEETYDSNLSQEANGNVSIRILLESLGKGGKPEIVSSIDDLDGDPIYRGAANSTHQTMIDSPSDRVGIGQYGDGYYFSNLEETADGYAQMSEGDGNVIVAGLKKDAKVFNFNGNIDWVDKSVDAQTEAAKKLRMYDGSETPTEEQDAIFWLFYEDYASALVADLILKGYDAFTIGDVNSVNVGETYTIVLNREALQIVSI